jgi:tetratricopeptide (TPR) repeat protein
MIVAPLLVLAVLEAGLRLGGYGYSTGFFIGPDADGAYMPNPCFGWRFFPRAIARKAEPCFVSAKAPGTIRIFVLGSSAAQGVPNPSFSFGRVLEVLLRQRYPEVKFEVVNAAMTAINSHVSLEITRDCAAHQPDLFVVYMGNNEVVGPFGPGTIFQQWLPSRKLIRASVWLKSTRTGQLLGDVMGRLRSGSGSPTVWQGMEMFVGNKVAADDPRLPAVYDNYRQNLRDICATARQAGAGVILSTIAVNIEGCPPLASQHRSGLTAEELRQWESRYQAGAELEGQGKRLEAIARYEAAAQIDDRYAELQYRLGQCLVAQQREPEARDRFVSARDLDALRFRADSRINAIVREVASEGISGVRLVDAEKAFAKGDLATDGIEGKDMFYEHVHFTFDGNYALARCMLDGVCEALPQLASSPVQRPVPSRRECAQSLVLTLWDEYRMAQTIAAMTSRPPFTSQLDHASRQASVERRGEDLGRRARTPQALNAARAAYEEGLERTPDDWHLHYQFGQLALASGLPKVAAEHFRAVRKELIHEASLHDSLGQAAQGCGQTDEAIAHFRKAIEIDPSLPLFHSNLGIVLSKRGQVDEAMAEHRKALEIDPDCAMIHFNFAVALDDCGRTDEAVEQYEEALKSDPALTSAHTNLGDILNRQGRFDEAVSHFRRVLAIDPKSAKGHINLGIALRGLGRLDEAIAEYEKALQFAPRSAMLHNSLAVTLADRGRIDEAAEHFQTVLRLDPSNQQALRGLATVRKRSGDAAKKTRS